MITCVVHYIIDPEKLAEFEVYANLWIPIVNRMGGQHHGYFLPSEGANDVAYALFSFESLATYEQYRTAAQTDAGCQAAFQYAKDHRCVKRVDRSFFKPVFGKT